MPEAFISIGSNLGDRISNIRKSIQYMKESSSWTQRMLKIEDISSIYETEAYGMEGNFMNCVIKIKTDLSCYELLKLVEDIEKSMGRNTKGDYKPRIIDLDILFYNNLRINKKNLKIPHPKMYEREFVLVPLSELKLTKKILKALEQRDKLIGKIIKNYGKLIRAEEES
jgi:2-amino-4-hydroxy-6-hydroxymethyldihydropteridine diphosphokinase